RGRTYRPARAEGPHAWPSARAPWASCAGPVPSVLPFRRALTRAEVPLGRPTRRPAIPQVRTVRRERGPREERRFAGPQRAVPRRPSFIIEGAELAGGTMAEALRQVERKFAGAETMEGAGVRL